MKRDSLSQDRSYIKASPYIEIGLENMICLSNYRTALNKRQGA
jgi:hypothetical protein